MRRPRPPARRSRRAAFTLIEMTVVMLIMALGTVLAIPMIEGGFTSREVRRAARQIASHMHFCRNEALSLGEPQAMVIDPNDNSIRTTGGRWAVLTDRARIDEIRGGIEAGAGAVEILCFPNGSTSGLEVVIAARRDSRENRIRIVLDPMVGSVRVEDA